MQNFRLEFLCGPKLMSPVAPPDDMRKIPLKGIILWPCFELQSGLIDSNG
jgi:hypothetical protein